MARTFTSLAAASLGLMIPIAAEAGQAPVNLPEGAGKPLVEAVCTTCHNLNMISNSSGYSADHWRELISTMADLSSTPAQRDTIVNYLATNFPATNNRRPAKPVAGPVNVTFKSWIAPTLGQRARDPVQAPDGAIWYNGQFGNLIGRIDRQTGAMKEWKLPEGAHPHSITPDAAGNIWYTGNGNGTVGKFDPKTEQFTVYPMPDPAARDPHTAIFHRTNGNFYFTLQQSQMLGRLDVKTGKVTLVKTPTARSNPYGIKEDSQGFLWVSCNASNCLLRLDPDTMEIREYKTPRAETTIRRLVITPDDMVWYTNSSLGGLGRFNPKTGEFKEWDSPSGRMSHPYGIEQINGIIWYDESGVRPDMLVRFDPKTEKFQSWPIKSGNVHAGIVRHMRATPQGTLLIHQSSTNHIMEVTIDEGRN
jgi:virginiamycin B lyase